MKKYARPLVRGGAALLVLVLAAAWIIPLPERLAQVPSTVVRFRDGTPAYVFLSPDEKWRIQADLPSIDPKFVSALLRLEDKRFGFHPGVDPLALARALGKNVLRRRVVTGGSTITMQLVRVLEPRPRKISSKIVEILRSLQIELRLSKDEILASYLTYAPYGRNIEGVEAAAWAYFGHGAGALSTAEIATLLAVPQNPNRRYPSLGNGERLRAARARVGGQLVAWGALGETPEKLREELALAPIPSRLRAFPKQAPHAAFWLKAQRPGETDLRTTLDAGIQSMTERVARAAAHAAMDQGVKNNAVVVVDNETAELRALVGGFDFWQGKDGAQIIAFDVPRSPGSALKPFLYAHAIDRGLALPEHLVEDVPRNFSGYSPRNMDGRFNGLVELEHALAQSLNIPFVNLLERVGLERFLGVLGYGGVKASSLPPGKLGLSAAIGGIEVTALELAGLYTALARDGEYRPLVAFAGDADRRADALAIFGRGASFLTRRALRIRDRPDFPRRRDATKLPASVFWKTGTSFGHKDAWAVGGTNQHTAAVWFGNLNYAPSFALVGSDMAAPLLFNVLESLTPASEPVEPDLAPEDLMAVEVCAYSGHLPGPGCLHKHAVLAPRSAVPTTSCSFHIALEVDTASGLAVAPMCRAGKTLETKRFMIWPSSVKRYLSDAHRTLPEPPAYHPSCAVVNQRAKLSISSPKPNHVVLLIPGVPADKQEVPFEAETDSLSGTLNWFVNGEFLGAHPATSRVWWAPKAGEFDVVVTDGQGLLASRKVTVRHRP